MLLWFVGVSCFDVVVWFGLFVWLLLALYCVVYACSSVLLLCLLGMLVGVLWL